LRNEARALFFQFGDALTAYSGRNGEAERPEPQMSECSERARDGLMAARAA
jgi:hypothetical protein